jgi:signal transduction histidine kinase
VKSFFFVLRILIAWSITYLALAILWIAPGHSDGDAPLIAFWLWVATAVFVIAGAVSHLRRVRLITGRIDAGTLGNRQRRQIEIPLEAGEAFDLLDAAIRELPRTEEIESARDSLQVRAKVKRPALYGQWKFLRLPFFGNIRNQILATVTPIDGAGSVTLICEPESGAWSDWFRVDDATNLENAEAITRAISRRVSELRRRERSAVEQTSTEKELAVAKLNLLNAQVEPHFLYNTLASAQYLTRSEPARADEMLGHLIQYLRHSLPRTEQTLSTLGEELERARSYLQILKIRMGTRLELKLDVPESLLPTPLPPMMLQTLVENAIKHGLEPKPGGGTVWINARRDGDLAVITVADDGNGFSTAGGGTGIGLKNLRERLRLVYDGHAALAVVANMPAGVAATISVPTDAQWIARHG